MAVALSSFRQPASLVAVPIRWVDLCGALLSGLCAVHCAVTPVLVGVLPALAGEGTEMGLRRALLTLGLLGVGLGVWLHRDRRALVPLGGGLLLAALLELGAIVPAWEVFVSLGISAFLIAAHALNTRACNTHCHGCAPARFWASQVEALGRAKFGTGLLAVAAALLVHASVLAAVLRIEPTAASSRVAAPRWIEVDVTSEGPPFADTRNKGLAVLAASEETLSTEASTEPPHEKASRSVGAPASAPPLVPASPASEQRSAEAPAVFDRVLIAPGGAAKHEAVVFDRTLDATGGAAASGNRADATGNAVSVDSAAANGRSAVAGRGPGASLGQARAAGRLVEAAELSRQPTQPAHLGALIQASYPASARSQGVSGVGRARLLVSSTGHVVQAEPLSDAPKAFGFADACADALRGSRGWGEPLDSGGRPVSTWIRFSCEFSIRH